MSEVNKQFVTIQIRRGLESELASSNVILASGEPVYAIDSKILKIGEGTKTWSQLTSYSFQMGSFANSVHTHDISGIIDLQSVLDSKQPSGNIPISDISGLQDQLDAKQVAGDYSVNGHTHTSSEITDFTDSVNALVPVSNIVAGDNISITQDGTVFTINGSGGGGSNFTPNYEVYTSSINLTGSIDYAENKQVQNIDLLGTGIVISKGSGWPSANQNVSNEIICRFNVTHPSGASISWNILSEWYNEPSDPLPSGSHLVALRTMKIPYQNNFIIGTYLGYKTVPSVISAIDSPIIDIPGLILYLRADTGVTYDENNLVTGWNDQSGQNNNAIADIGEEPIYVASGIGNQPTLDFNGAEILTIPYSDSMDIPTLSVFMVVQRDDDGAGNSFTMMRNDGIWGIALDINQGSNWFVTSHTQSPTDFDTGQEIGNTPHLIGFTNSGTELFAYLDSLKSNSLLSGVFSTGGSGSLQIGGYDESFGGGTEKCNAKISEVMLFNRVLTSGEIDGIINYAGSRYGI